MRILQHALRLRAGGTRRGGVTAALAIALLAAGCAKPAPEAQAPAEPAPIRLDVARIDVVNLYEPTRAAPFYEHRMSPSPADGAIAWASNRLAAVGGAGVGVVAIETARVRETVLDEDVAPGGFDTRRFDATLRVRMTLRRPNGAQSEALVEATRRLDAPADRPETILEDELDAMVADLITDLDREAEARLRALDGRWVR